MLDDLIPIYGEPFLRYVLACDDQGLSELTASDAQRRTVEQLRALASSAEVGEGLTSHMRLALLIEDRAANGTSTANAMRLLCGGELLEVAGHEDLVLGNLLEIARDVWPSLLMRPSTRSADMPGAWQQVGLINHPHTVEAARAFLADDDLRRLFPHAPPPDEITSDHLLDLSSYWVGSVGRGASHQLIGLLGAALSNAQTWASIEPGADSWHGFSEALAKVLAAMRGLARGETVAVPRLVAFSGLQVPEGTTVALADGELRAPRSFDRSLLPTQAEEATAILASTYPLQISQIRPYEGKSVLTVDWATVEPVMLEAQQRVDLTRLAVLLASPEDEFWGLAQVASVVFEPTAADPIRQWQRNLPWLPQAKLDDGGAQRIEAWSPLLAERHMPKLDIAMRRTLSAVAERSDTLDGFVDSVIAWENCFGTKNETTFRVTAAMATLLEPDSAEDRLARQKELKRLYGARSEIVHGALHPSAAEAGELREQALRAGVECLRRLYRDRPDLLELQSDVRSTRLVLG